ncbi:MAG: c-type cytochrome [Anaerolineales bacterium]|nr:c-type cytochrome [Anaerolineales bacterium]
MNYRLIALFALLLLALTACSLAEDITPPPGYQSPTPVATLGQLYPAEPPSPASGAAIYVEKCQPCHGETGLGNGPLAGQLPVAVPAIGLIDIAGQSSPADWFTLLTQGRLERGMPPFQSLSARERWDVLAYTYTLSASPEALAQAADLYTAHCAVCHGLAGDANPAADLTDQQYNAAVTGTRLYRAIAEGMPPSMPAYAGQFSEDQIWSLTVHLRTLAYAPAAQPTATPVPTATPEPAASEIPAAQITAEGATDETPVGEETLTAGATELVNPETAAPTETTAFVSGRVIHGAGGVLPADMTAVLHIYDTAQEVSSITAFLASDGSFAFGDVPLAPQGAYQVQVEYGGVTYFSEPGFDDGATTEFDLPVIVYESTTDASAILLLQAHVIVNPPSNGMLPVIEIFIFTNPSDRSVIFEVGDQGLSFLPAPQGATIQSLQYSESSLPFVPAGDESYALIPSPEGQYGIVAVYALPYEADELAFEQSLGLETADLTLLVPDGMRLRDHGLTDAGPTDFQGQPFQQYGASNLPAGGTLAFTIQGVPGGTGGFSLDSQSGLVIGMGVLGVVFIAAGVYLYLRDRSRAKEEEGEGGDEDSLETEDALGDDPQAIMDAIISLDDQFKAGQIAEEAYQERRAELKARLKQLS